MGKVVPAVRVLVVDDDPSIGEYVETVLGKEGFEVGRISDPSLAEGEVKDGGYHAVVLDVMMPGLDGLEVLRRIRRVDDDVAVVMMTGHPSLETAVQAMKLDAVDYVKKPFEPDDLRAALDRIVKKKGLTRSAEELLNRHIGETIRNLRKERTLTLKQLARRTSLSVSLLSQIERAESSASVGSLYKIASALEVPVAQLFGEY